MMAVNIYLVLNVIRGVLRGTLVALGLQKQVIGLNIWCNWLLNFLLLYILCFYNKLGLLGIFLSKIISENVNNILYFVLIERENWRAIAEEARARLEKSMIENSNMI